MAGEVCGTLAPTESRFVVVAAKLEKVDTPCKTKDEMMSKDESDSIPLLELDDVSPIKLNTNTDENKQPSPSMLFTKITPSLKKGLMMRQSRLASYTVENNEKMMSSSIDKHKAANILHSDEDEVIEASPMQRSVASKIKVLKDSKIKKKLKEGIAQLNQSEISSSDDISKDSKISDSVATPHTASPIKSVELSSNNSFTTDEYPEKFQVLKSPLVEVSLDGSLMLPPNSESQTKDATSSNKASNFDKLVPPPSEPEPESAGLSSVTHSGLSNSNNNNKV
ncbi:uncharacterized protein [Temnothorax longispinosus]|uniref:uncharacterized protein n=1 Tax=Temnothorax longispinosus TaxID=300112 RepID=UPI003A996771